MASGQHVRSHQLGNCWQEKCFLQTADVIGQNSLHILPTDRKVQITVSWGRSDFVTFDRLRMFETHCLGLGGGVQAPCYSGRCPAEGARELPKERVHAGKSSSASAAGKGHLQSVNTRGALWKCVSKLAGCSDPVSRGSGRGLQTWCRDFFCGRPLRLHSRVQLKVVGLSH